MKVMFYFKNGQSANMATDEYKSLQEFIEGVFDGDIEDYSWVCFNDTTYIDMREVFIIKDITNEEGEREE